MRKTTLDTVDSRGRHLADLLNYWNDGIKRTQDSMRHGASNDEKETLKKLRAGSGLLTGYIDSLSRPATAEDNAPTFPRADLNHEATRYTHLADLYELWNDAMDILLNKTSPSEKDIKLLMQYGAAVLLLRGRMTFQGDYDTFHGEMNVITRNIDEVLVVKLTGGRFGEMKRARDRDVIIEAEMTIYEDTLDEWPPMRDTEVEPENETGAEEAN